MNLVTMFVKGIPPIIFALFIGPWSDKFGRKFLIVFPLIGYVLYDVWFLINVIFFDYFTADWLMLEFMQYWAGGYMCFFLGLYSYASDVSDESTRTVRIAVVDFVFFSGLSIGNSLYDIKYARWRFKLIFFRFRGLWKSQKCLWIRNYLCYSGSFSHFGDALRLFLHQR